MTPWTAAHQAPLSMKFSRQGYWSGLPFPSPGDLPNLGIEPGSAAFQADSLPTELQGYLGWFQFRATTNNAAVSILVHVCCSTLACITVWFQVIYIYDLVISLLFGLPGFVPVSLFFLLLDQPSVFEYCILSSVSDFLKCVKTYTNQNLPL